MRHASANPPACWRTARVRHTGRAELSWGTVYCRSRPMQRLGNLYASIGGPAGFPIGVEIEETESVTNADIIHRAHAIIESVFAELIDGP